MLLIKSMINVLMKDDIGGMSGGLVVDSNDNIVVNMQNGGNGY
jgi:hypothetical protein